MGPLDLLTLPLRALLGDAERAEHERQRTLRLLTHTS
jgi:hypothetical protein